MASLAALMDQFWLTDEQFEKIAPHLRSDTRGKLRVDDRRVISGIIHVLKVSVSGIPSCVSRQTQRQA